MKTIIVKWQNEDELPEMTDDDYDRIYPESTVFGGIGVRMFPYVEIKNNKYYLGVI